MRSKELWELCRVIELRHESCLAHRPNLSRRDRYHVGGGKPFEDLVSLKEDSPGTVIFRAISLRHSYG